MARDIRVATKHLGLSHVHDADSLVVDFYKWYKNARARTTIEVDLRQRHVNRIRA